MRSLDRFDRLSRQGRRPIALGAACASLLALALHSPARADEPAAAAAASALRVAAIEVEPESPGPDTLCRLRVRIANAGERDAASLGFTVRVDGVELPVYRNQLFVQRIPAGATETVALYNFWSTETSRPALPADGKLRVEVELREAQWMQIGDEDGVEVWRPLGAVEGLPVRAERVLATRSSAAGGAG